MRLMRFVLFPSFLATLSLTGCHQTQMQPLPGSAHPAYTITDLGVGMPLAINNKGQVVGFSDVNSRSLEYHPVLWEHGQIKDLTKFIPRETRWLSMEGAAGINDRGQIVGDGGMMNRPGHYDQHIHAYLLTPR